MYLDVNPLSKVQFSNSFSHPMGRPSLSLVPLGAQKLLLFSRLMKPSLPVSLLLPAFLASQLGDHFQLRLLKEEPPSAEVSCVRDPWL